jgi:hypothetical protein
MKLSFFKRKTFHGVNGPYLTVYTLLDWKGARRTSLCVHQFHRGDEDPDCHDHPFNFWSLVLLGGYREFAQNGTFIVRWPLSLVYRPATHRHRVQLLRGYCWTLILKRDAAREWGFWTPTGFVHWRDYIASKGLTPLA